MHAVSLKAQAPVDVHEASVHGVYSEAANSEIEPRTYLRRKVDELSPLSSTAVDRAGGQFGLGILASQTVHFIGKSKRISKEGLIVILHRRDGRFLY